MLAVELGLIPRPDSCWHSFDNSDEALFQENVYFGHDSLELSFDANFFFRGNPFKKKLV